MIATNHDLETWAEHGFRPHPIIPPGAQTVAPDGEKAPEAGKAPGMLRRDGLWGSIKWHRAEPGHFAGFRPSIIAGAGIGVRGGEGHVFVDCDLMDPLLSMSFLSMTGAVLGLGPRRDGRQPKWAMAFRTEEQIATRVLTLLDGGSGQREGQIELIGFGRQIVVQSTHKDTGKPYTWDRDPCGPLAMIPLVTAEMLGDWLHRIPVWAGEHGLIAKGRTTDPSRGQEKAAPEDIIWPGVAGEFIRLIETAAHPAHTDRDTWINVGMAIKAALPHEPERAYRAWLRWSQRWEGGENSERECEYRWRGFHSTDLGWRYVADRLAGGGGETAAAAVFAKAGDPEVPEGPPPPAPGDEHLDPEQQALMALLRTVQPGGAAPKDPTLIQSAAAYLARGLAGRLVHVPHANEVVFVWGSRWRRCPVSRIMPCLFLWGQLYADEYLGGEGAKLQKARNMFKDAFGGEKAAKALLAAIPADLSDDFDTDFSMLNTPSGIVDLRTGEIRRVTEKDRVRYSTAVAPAKGDMPLFRELLERVTAGMGQQGAEHVQLMFGSALLGNPQQRFWVVRGPTGNGKSTLVRVLELVLGPDYAQSAQSDFLTAKEEPRYMRAGWKGVRLINFGEAPTGRRRLNAERVKFLASHDSVKARHAYSDGWVTYEMHALAVMCANSTPVFDTEAGDEAVIARLETTADPSGVGAGGLRNGLADAGHAARIVREEGGAVLAWAIEGARKVAAGALARADDTQRVLRFQTASGSDVVGAWIGYHLTADRKAAPENEVPVAAICHLMREWVEAHRTDDAGSLVPLVTDPIRVGKALAAIGAPKGRSAKERKATAFVTPALLLPDGDPRVQDGYALGWRAWQLAVNGKVDETRAPSPFPPFEEVMS